MLVWKGWGLLSLGIPLICSWLTEFVVNYNFGAGFYQASEWLLPLVLSLSSIPVFFLGYKLNRMPGRILIDIETNEKIELKTSHSFFWIPMHYWSVIIVAISLRIYASNLAFI